MNRKACWILLAVAFLALSLITGCGSSSSTPPAKVVTVAATTGSSQSATVGAAFANALVATVTTGGTPTAGVTVTFTAPSSGASGTFAGGANTATTNSSGVATSAVFTANTTAGSYMVTASSSGATTPASFSLTNTAGPAATIVATSGSGQSATISTAFANPLAATVEDSDSNPVSGVTVTFTAPASGASGTFADSHNNVTTATTNSSGVATSAVFTANATTGGPYMVSAVAAGVAAPVNFSLTNSAVVVGTSTNYSFYLSGADVFGTNGYSFLAIAGAVTIKSDGTVTAGEQDYNDATGVTSPQPGGDKITGGTLSVSATTGQGTLTLITNNTHVGVSGTETFGVQFVNAKHALIMQFDGTATSSGSMDVQTLPSTPSGGFAITLSGVDKNYNPTTIGGVFTITGTSLAGTIDENDAGTVATNQPFAATLTAADAMGRGTLSITGGGSLINYYIVGPEVVRIIDVDTAKVSIGSAFGQGSGSFNNASLGTSVFAIAGNPWVSGVGAVGQFSTSNTSNSTADFSGVGDDEDLVNAISAPASAITGTYSIASDGYGSMTITSGLGADMSILGVYMTDPALNLNDPNNSSGGGGALVLDLDSGSGTAPAQPGTTGVITPQTDTVAAHFTNSYAVSAQDFNNFTAPNCSLCEFDMLAQGTMTSGTLSLTGMVSDPFTTLTSATKSSGNTFSGTPTPDGSNPGRYSSFSLAATINGGGGHFDVVIYQASGEQLFWLEDDANGVWVGPLQQQGSLTGIPSVQKPTTKPQLKHKD